MSVYELLAWAFFSLIIPFFVLVIYLRFFCLDEMDSYMSKGRVAAHRRGPEKFSMFPLSGDVLMEYGGASASRWIWKRRFSDVDRASVPRHLRVKFALFFLTVVAICICMALSVFVR